MPEAKLFRKLEEFEVKLPFREGETMALAMAKSMTAITHETWELEYCEDLGERTQFGLAVNYESPKKPSTVTTHPDKIEKDVNIPDGCVRACPNRPPNFKGSYSPQTHIVNQKTGKSLCGIVPVHGWQFLPEPGWVISCKRCKAMLEETY